MICPNCKTRNPDGERFCPCGAYLRVEPGAYHRDLLQLSRSDFVEALSEGIPLIISNVTSLWNEANEISRIGPRRAVGILQGIAEEEAAKVLLLIDCLRCPLSRIGEYQALLKQFDKHLAKGVYARYYDTSPHDLAEVGQIVELETRSFYREGDYGEFTLPNTIIYWRESRLYVSYIRNDDGSHSWHAPHSPDFLDGHIIPSGAITLVNAMNDLGLFSKATLAEVAAYWQKISFESVDPATLQSDSGTNVSWGKLRDYNLRMFQAGGINFKTGDLAAAQALVDRWLFPLYPFDLGARGSIVDLAPPDSPDWY